MRKGQATKSEEHPGGRLATGATVEELELVGDRLHYRLLPGQSSAGPATGWVSVSLKDKPLLRKLQTPASTPLQAVPGTAGLWECTAWSDDAGFGQGHEGSFGFMLKGLRKEAKAQAEELDAKYKKGEFPPCIYVERMMAAEVPKTGGLLLYSVVPITPELKADVDEKGGCKVIVVPNSEHTRHQGGWMQAFPEAVVVFHGGDDVKPMVEAGGAQACVLGSETAAKALQGFDCTVLDMSGFKEIVACHQKSKSLFTSDSIYLGCADKEDPSGWKNHPAPEWTRLYFKAFMEKSPSHLPTYRMLVGAEQQKPIAATLQEIIAWKPQRVMSSRSGKTSEGGVEEAKKVLLGHWGWCKA